MTRAGLRLRPGPLRAAAGLAVFFIAARVVYRILFHGADGEGPVVLPLPAIRLPAPFSWVTLLGPATLDGIGEAVLSALPIAGVVLLFGLLNALFDVSRAFGRLARRGPFRGIARALAVAWSTLPGLGQAVRTVRTAQRLRGERAGPRMLVPVLERTLERAAAVAAGLELRGFGGSPVDGDPERPAVVREAAFGFGEAPVLTVPGFSPRRGALEVVTGPTGTGKSTLLRGLAGLVDHVDGGWSRGEVEVTGLDRRRMPPRDASRAVGVVLQNPREGFCTDVVRDEIGLALQVRGVATAAVRARVDEVAAALGLSGLLERSVHTLSAGEATLVAIAGSVVEQPALLLIDEPLADLDADARVRVVAALDRLAHESGIGVVVAEHRAEPFAPVADRWWTIVDGALVPAAQASSAEEGAADAPARTADGRERDRSLEHAAPAPGARPALAAAHLRVAHGDTTVVADASIALGPGEIAALIGPNGAGKSSFLLALALPPQGAEITGSPVLVPDASDDLFTRDTVAAECAHADRRAPGPASAVLFASFLGLDDASRAGLLARHPRDLSLGERRCLAIALQLSRRPDALLIDEPTRGLDAAARDQVRGALQRAADAGTAVLLATHDIAFADALRARIVPMRDGVVPASARPASALPDSAGPDSAGPESAPPASASARAVRRGESHPSEESGPEGGVSRPSSRRTVRHPNRRWAGTALLLANLVAVAAFTWPLLTTALPSQAQAAAPWVALALAPVAVIVTITALDRSVRSAHVLAYLGVLAAIGTALRIASTGVGGVEAVFLMLILAGRVFGARFGMLLGVSTILLSSTVFGGFGPWTPFQMFACGWVGAGAGLLPRRVRGWAEVWMLCAYGAVSSYVFGLLLNLWFWPFAVGPDTAISYTPGAPLWQNLGSFLLYSFVTSTAGWDTLRAITTIVGITLIGRPVLAAFRRAKPLAAPARHDDSLATPHLRRDAPPA
ncbi:ATP-binding cassette domain-containing protein [Microbacterium sp.]|uniref:ATP-binding cassette domain-containing protein n=1 Tax=Microbacterium sp. TaxID=51671 RepID=UPI0039E26762